MSARVYLRHAAKPSPAEELTYGGAERLRSNGFAVVPADPKTGQPYGAWAVFQPTSNATDRRGDYIAALCSCPPPRGLGAQYANPRATYLAALVVDVRNRKVAEEIEAAIAPRLQWMNSSRVQPVRVASDGSTLRPFQLAGEPFSNPFTLKYRLTGDGWADRPHRAEVLSANQFFTVSGPDPSGVPYRWERGTLADVHRDLLPVLDMRSAHALVNVIEDVLSAHGTPV